MKRYFRTLFFLLLTVWAGASAQAVNAEDAHRRNPIIVAVIDGGFDLTHPYLQPYLWYNENERPADGIDHDGNGLVNDYRGWNFLGNSEGTSFSRAGTCEYRAWKGLRLRKLAGEQLTEAEEHLSDSLARRMHLDLYVLQAEDAIQKKKEGWELEQQHLEQLNKDDDAHRAIGNNPDDVCNLTYGNNTLNYNDEDSYHGTMVTGLVAQVAKQLDADIRILPIRAIPDGDEYDRDVAAALKYAIDHGASVINMSFGKTISPHRALVDSLLDEAARRDILLVKASGNNGKSEDVTTYYPTPITLAGQRRENMLVVGSVGKDGKMIRFSNYGRRTVDVLAPGEEVRSIAPGGEWSQNNGTSLSAPIVSGLAAAIRQAYPRLTAAQVRQIIMQSSTPLEDTPIAAGVVDIERAMKAARDFRPYRVDTLYNCVLNTYPNVKWLDDEDRKFFFTKKVWNADKTATHEEYYLGDTRTKKVVRVDSIMKAPQRPYSFPNNRDYWKDYSADSLSYIYAYDDDIYLARMERTDSGLVRRDSVRMTMDGEHFFSYASGGNSMNGSHGRGSAIGRWIGKTHTFIVVREDKRQMPTLTYVDNLAEPRPKAHTMKYPMPSDTAVAQYHVYLFDSDRISDSRLKIDAYDDQIIETPRFTGVVTSGDYAYLIRKSRPEDQVDLLRVDPVTKTAKVLIHEECKPHLNNELFNYHVLNNGKDILWWAERGDRGQWFLYDGDGNLKNAITPPDMVAGEIIRIDTLERSIILKGYGREREASNPAYTYYYRVGFNGKGFTLLTPGDGNHSITFSHGGKFIEDRYSRINDPGRSSIRDLKGRLIADLGAPDISAAKATGWNLPQQVKVTAADGETPLYGIVYTPFNMRPEDRLPIISNPYPGPHTDLMTLDFSFDDDGNQALADDGFIVICFSYRGSNPWRGRKFYTHGYGNLRDYTLDDDYATIRQIAALIPQADTTRVGIYGHSGGGFVTTAAMLTRPDFYKVGVAASGNHDNNIYLKQWGEVYHGIHQVTDSLGHKHWDAHIPTTMELAKNLKGNLLLIHGDVDNNVHPASTIRMAHALIQANKRFDMLIIPGADHGLDNKYYPNVVRSYFREHLLGEKESIDFK